MNRPRPEAAGEMLLVAADVLEEDCHWLGEVVRELGLHLMGEGSLPALFRPRTNGEKAWRAAWGEPGSALSRGLEELRGASNHGVLSLAEAERLLPRIVREILNEEEPEDPVWMTQAVSNGPDRYQIMTAHSDGRLTVNGRPVDDG